MTQLSDDRRILVLSHHHELLPFANRLRSEGYHPEVAVWRERYSAAWEGLGLRRRLLDYSEQTVETTVPTVLSGNHTVQFSSTAKVYGTLVPETVPADAIRFGGWFDGEQVHLKHLLVVDRGAWVGGAGPQVDACATLVWLDPTALVGFLDSSYTEITQYLKDQAFKGLFQFDMKEEPDGFKRHGLRAGWPPLHTHAFLAELQGFGELLQGGIPTPPSVLYVTALAITVPPWPNPGKSPRQPITGLTQTQLGQFFWHDVRQADSGLGLETAGLDGLVGVAIGSSTLTPELARLKAQELAFRIQLTGKQYRTDGGLSVPGVLATLEARFGS